jgi:hypothetical protein
MQQKNIPISILRKFDNMPSLLYKGRFIIVVISAALLLLTSCSKSSNSITTSVLQQYFTTNLLNTNFVIQFASDSGVDITNRYVNDTFVLKQADTSLFNGPMTAKRDTTIYTGTWSSNSDYSQLNINITAPSPIPTDYIFINRSWKFTKKALPVMELAPWGSTDPKVLYMQRL